MTTLQHVRSALIAGRTADGFTAAAGDEALSLLAASEAALETTRVAINHALMAKHTTSTDAACALLVAHSEAIALLRRAVDLLQQITPRIAHDACPEDPDGLRAVAAVPDSDDEISDDLIEAARAVVTEARKRYALSWGR